MILWSQRSSGMRAIGEFSSDIGLQLPEEGVPGFVHRVRSEVLERGIDRLEKPEGEQYDVGDGASDQFLNLRVGFLARFLVVRTQRQALQPLHLRRTVAGVVRTGRRKLVA